jgi:hypothetical protein
VDVDLTGAVVATQLALVKGAVKAALVAPLAPLLMGASAQDSSPVIASAIASLEHGDVWWTG